MVTRCLRSSSKFNAVIGQNLTSEFMRKIYAASRNLKNIRARVKLMSRRENKELAKTNL